MFRALTLTVSLFIAFPPLGLAGNQKNEPLNFNSLFSQAPLFPQSDYSLNLEGSTKVYSDLVTEELDDSPLDISYRRIKVRMFPIMSIPLGDPFPLTDNPDHLKLVNSKGLRVLSEAKGQVLAEGQTLILNFEKSQFILDGRIYPLEKLGLHPLDPSQTTQVSWDLKEDQIYKVKIELRGAFEVALSEHTGKRALRVNLDVKVLHGDLLGTKGLRKKSFWSLFNILPLNEYLYSVVSSEVPSNWEMEALKAQAIAARTYALYEMIRAREALKRDWDVDPTTWYQSYQGRAFQKDPKRNRVIERPSTNQAVDETGYKAIYFEEKIIAAFFSANSGGLTCTATECFHLKGSNPGYLQSVEDAPNIRQVGRIGTWGKDAKVTRKNVEDLLKKLGLSDVEGNIVALEPYLSGPSGRIWKLKVIRYSGEDLILSLRQTRRIMSLFGPIRSYLYELFPPDAKGHQQVKGYGYGHGVGLSQWGAELFARRGWKAVEILEHFYTDVTVR